MGFQQEVEDFLRHRWHDLDDDNETVLTRAGRLPLQLDCYTPSRKLAVEVNGDITHSTAFKHYREGVDARTYHQNKAHLAAQKGVTLAFVWQADWFARRSEVKAALHKFATTGELSPILTQLLGPNDQAYDLKHGHIYDHAVNNGGRELHLDWQAILHDLPHGTEAAYKLLDHLVEPNEVKGYRLHSLCYDRFAKEHRTTVNDLHIAVLELVTAGVLVQVPAHAWSVSQGTTLLMNDCYLTSHRFVTPRSSTSSAQGSVVNAMQERVEARETAARSSTPLAKRRQRLEELVKRLEADDFDTWLRHRCGEVTS